MQMLLVERRGPVALVTVNRPDKLNALNRRTLEELRDVFGELQCESKVRVIVLTGAGEKAFVAGADIAEFQGMSQVDAEAASRFGQGVFALIAGGPKIVIAAVNGFALGGGLELALAAHIRLSGEKARFGLPEVKLGLIPGYGGTQRLAREIGPGRATQMMTSADMIDAPKALQWGLVSEVLPLSNLLDRSLGLASTIAAMAPLATARVLQALHAGWDGDKGFAEESRQFGACFSSEDLLEGVKAFLEKRQPVFQGK